MALLSESIRKTYFKRLGLGEYNTENIKKLQKKYMRSSDVDGIYGPDTDKVLRTVYNCSLVKNFEPKEFRCPCGKCTGYPSYIKQVELTHIQTIRDHYNVPMVITSGLRCSYENKRVGGIPNSGHLTGYAVDFYMSGVTDTVKHRTDALQYIKELPDHEFTYGACIVDSEGHYRSAPEMGNAMHTETHEPAVSQIGKLANDYAYSTNTAKASYKDGSPTDVYKAGLNKAYPDRSKWGKAPRAGASCDVFVGTCVRNSGIDKKFPRGLADQIPYLAKSDKFAEVSVTAETARDGDIIIYTKTAGGAHVCIVYDGKIKEAGFESYYPKTTNYLSQRLSKKGKNWVKVYRAK